jgi:hypothetical protein
MAVMPRTRKTEVSEAELAVAGEALDRAVSRALRIAEAKRAVDAARKAEERRRAEEERREAAFIGGPCAYCGVTRSAVLHEPDVRRGDRPGPPEERPFWTTSAAGPCCAWCDDERRSDIDPSRVLPDEEHRDRVARRLVGPDLARHHLRGYLAEKVGFRWWHEAPGPGTTRPRLRRFTHLDPAKLRDAARVSESSGSYGSGEPCPRCGCAHMWVTVREPYERRVSGSDQTYTAYDERRRCMGCAWADDLASVVERLVGLNVRHMTYVNDSKGGIGGPASDVRFAVEWYDPGRLKMRSVRNLPRRTGPAVNLVPFGYLDVPALRRKAYEAYPDEKWWADKSIWRRLKKQEARRA